VANAWGPYDMHGNYEGAPNDGRPWLEANCTRRVLCGGSWRYDRTAAKCDARDNSEAGGRYVGVGFRVVCASVMNHR
jgi:formylglycine-generating enzyme required for sulfatase activity